MKGLIRNKDQVKQAIDFVGLEWGEIHPADIDAVLEFDNEVLILFEVKREGYIMPKGQRILLERLCNNWKGKSIVFKCDHKHEDNDTIMLNNCVLTYYYYNGQWWGTDKKIKVLEAIKLLAEYWQIKKLLK